MRIYSAPEAGSVYWQIDDLFTKFNRADYQYSDKYFEFSLRKFLLGDLISISLSAETVNTFNFQKGNFNGERKQVL